MTYTETTPSYNERRYGKPWLAIITVSTTKDFQFINWEGRPGCAGEFCFDAEPGTLLAYGQKDIRKGRGGVDGYRICMPDGSLAAISDDIAIALRKLPEPQRPAEAAKQIIAACEETLAEYSGKTDTYYIAECARLDAKIERFRAFLSVAVATATAPVVDFGI